MTTIVKQVIMVDLDALLDVRLSILTQMNPIWVDKVLDTKYRYRDSDDWSKLEEGIGQTVYNELYEQRDVYDLMRAKVTNLMPKLIEVISQYEEDSDLFPELGAETVLAINTHPYQLNKEEEIILINIMKTYLGIDFKVRLIRASMEELTLSSLVDKGFTQYITYHFSDWVKHHYDNATCFEDFDKHPSFTFIAPKIKVVGFEQADLEGIRQMGLGNTDPFELFREMFIHSFNTTFLPAYYFSLVDFAAYVEGVKSPSTTSDTQDVSQETPL